MKVKLNLVLKCDVDELELQHLKRIAIGQVTSLLELDHFVGGNETLEVLSLVEV